MGLHIVSAFSYWCLTQYYICAVEAVDASTSLFTVCRYHACVIPKHSVFIEVNHIIFISSHDTHKPVSRTVLFYCP